MQTTKYKNQIPKNQATLLQYTIKKPQNQLKTNQISRLQTANKQSYPQTNIQTQYLSNNTLQSQT